MQTQTIKEQITKVVLSQPEDASYDDIMRELAFERMVARGLNDVRTGVLSPMMKWRIGSEHGKNKMVV